MSEANDRDAAEVIRLLRRAVAASGLSQAAFARAVGTSAPRLSTYLSGETRPSAEFLLRSRRIGRALGAANSRGLMSAPVTAAAMRERLRTGEIAWVWRMLLQGRDHLAAMLEERDRRLLDAWSAIPGHVGSVQWDGLLAAVAAHEFDEAGLEPPAWAQGQPLDEPWIPEHPFLSPDRVRTRTPDWLSRRNIYIPERDLVTA